MREVHAFLVKGGQASRERGLILERGSLPPLWKAGASSRTPQTGRSPSSVTPPPPSPVRKALEQARADQSVNAGGAAATQSEIGKLESFLADSHAVSLAGQKAWRESGGAGGLKGLGNAVEAARAAAQTKLGSLREQLDKQSAMADASDRAIPGLEAAHQAAVIRSGTAAGELAALRKTAPQLNIALARTEYKGVVEAERKAEEAREKARRFPLAHLAQTNSTRSVAYDETPCR